jgi:hypothetical protein
VLRTIVLIGSIVVGSTVVAELARADTAAANRAAAEADALARAKDFRGAAAKFREAYAADPRPDLICNIGVAYHKAPDLSRAHLYLSRCLERGSALDDSKFLDVVRTTMSRIEAALRAGSYTPVDIVVEPRIATVAIDAFAADETFDGGRVVWLPYGNYRVTVRADGYRAQTVAVTAKDRAVHPLRVTLEHEPVVVVPPSSTDRDRERDADAKPPAGPDAAGSTSQPGEPGGRRSGGAPAVRDDAPAGEAPRSRSVVLPVAASVATVALGVVAVVARSRASDHAFRAEIALTDDAYDTEADSTRRWNTIFGVDLAITGAAAVASGYLWYRFVRAPRVPVARVEVSAGHASILITGQF